MTSKDFEIVERSDLYKGFFTMALYKLRHRLFRGGWSPTFSREVFERGAVAAVLPYDPVRDTVVLIEQFRPGAAAANQPPWMIEIVAGIIEPGESAEEMCRREAVEEAGCVLHQLEPIVDFFPSAGGCSERVHLFCGRVDSEGVGGVHGREDEVEDIRVFVEPADRAFAMLRKGKIESSIAVIGLLWLELNRDDLRRRWG